MRSKAGNSQVPIDVEVPPLKYVITGATGLLGAAILKQINTPDNQIVAISRNAQSATNRLPKGVKPAAWSDDSWKTAGHDADVIINLAGESIGGARWTPEFKQRLYDSRVVTTRTVVEAMRRGGPQQSLINASAVGYYGDTGSEKITEQHAPSNDFLGDLCKDWEKEALAACGFARVALIRTGLVLADGGALKQMLYPLPIKISPFKLGLGGPLGSGRQYWPWIHIDDAAGIFVWAAQNNTVTGPVNGTAPTPVTNAEFTKVLGRLLHRPALLPVPAFALRLALGEFAGALLGGQNAVPEATAKLGYTFKYPDLEAALKTLL